jgi:hypothetical protein
LIREKTVTTVDMLKLSGCRQRETVPSTENGV